MKATFNLAEKWFAVFVIFFSTVPIIPLFRSVVEGSVIYDGDPLIQVILSAIYLISLFLIILRWRRFIYVAKTNILLLLLTGLALVSALWSSDPIFTLHRGVALVGTTIFGIYLASRYSLKEQLQLLAWAFGIAALLSLLFVIIPPHYGITTKGGYAGTGRGIYYSKNALGLVMALSSIVFLLLALSKSKYKWFNWLAFGLSFCLLLLSTAKGPLLTLITVIVLLPIYKALRWHYSLRIPFLISVVSLSGVVGTLFLSNAETIFGALGKDITLTGRTQLWYLLFDLGLQHPWLGYGYSSFWRGWDGPSAKVWSLLFWQPRHSHNGILQLWLDLGLVGVLLFTLSFIQASVKAVAWVRSTKTMEYFWSLIFLAFMLLNNVTESPILAATSTMWMLYVATTFSITVQSEQQRKTSSISTTINNQGLAHKFYSEKGNT
jgi:O-antigen ligase